MQRHTEETAMADGQRHDWRDNGEEPRANTTRRRRQDSTYRQNDEKKKVRRRRIQHGEHTKQLTNN